MAELVWQPNSSAMKSFLAGGSGPAFRSVRKMQSSTAAAANRAVPVDTGDLKRAQVKTPVVLTGNKVAAGVEYLSKYALFVHEGTKPHEILPNRKKILTWVPRGPGGKQIFARRVWHPGTTAQPWLAESMEAAAKRHDFGTSRE